jgi:4-amino-4-deoxy-L-arabinose transferase-like glycosyltransferase
VQLFKKFYLLGLIIVLASVLRLYHLNSNPPGLTWDEAALGYNTYSLLKTGRDEYGTFLPLNLKSFGDYKPAVYAYIDIPFVALIGLNEWAVRLPSALFGILGVLGIYLLVKELFKEQKLALLSTLMFAISPWAIQFSRAAFEANIALVINIFAILLFLKGAKNGRFLYYSAVLFGVSLFTYQSSRILVPILILGLVIIFRSDLASKVQAKISGLFIVGVVIVLFLTTFLTGQTARLQTQNFFAYQRSSAEIQQISTEDGLAPENFLFQIIHGEWWAYSRGLVERYLIYFSPKMLFVDGDYSQRQRVPDLGSLYFLSVILVPIGLVNLLKRRDKSSRLVFMLLLLSPIPAVLSRDLISTLRALNMVVPWSILEGAGLCAVTLKIWGVKAYWKFLAVGAVFLLITFNFMIYLDRYFVHSPIEYSKYWLYGYKEALTGLKNTQGNYNKVIVSDIYGQPYIYYLFYNQYPPSDFQRQAKLDQPTVDVGTVRNIDNIEFRHIYWPNDRSLKGNLYIGSPDELPDKDILPYNQAIITKSINYLDETAAFKIVETKENSE